MGILLFVLKYMYISLLLKIIDGFSWPAKIMASPFNWDVDMKLTIEDICKELSRSLQICMYKVIRTTC